MKQRNTRTALSIIVALFLAAGCGSESPEKQLASAKEYLQKNDPKSATIQIKNALQANPGLGEARFLLGTILLKDGSASTAEVEFRKALAAKYPNDLVVPELARSMLMMGQEKKLVDEFGATKFDKPGANASLQTTLAAAYGAMGKPDLAQAALSAALAADPDYPPARLVAARQKAAGKDFEAAQRATEEVLAKDPANADGWKLKGDLLLFSKRDVEGALVAYRKSIEVDPKFGPGHVALMTLLLQQQKLDEAATQLAQLKKLAPKSPQTKYFEAQLAFYKKDYKLARELSRQLLSLSPANPRILQLAGVAEFQMNSFAAAELYLKSALDAAPGLALARRFLIATYLRTGKPAEALAALKAGTGRDGLDPSMFSLAGEVYLQNGDAKKAEEYFAKALKLDPENARKRTALAITHLAGGQPDAGFDELQNIAASDAGTTADLALISVHLRRKEFDKALAAIDKLEAKQPDKPLAANLRGQVQLAQKNPAAARKSFERALTLDPTYFAAAAGLATLDMADKKPEDAKKRFEALLVKNPKNGPALLALARIADTSGAGKDEVARLLSKAVEANPNEVGPRLLLIELFLRHKDNKQAAAAAQSGVAALPNSPELLAALGRVLQLSGDFNQAIATYTKLIAMQPLAPQPHIRLAEVHIANKNSQAAEQSLRKALEIKPDMLEAQRALIILAIEAKRYQDGIKIARTVQEQRPKAPVGFALEGDVAVAQKNWDVAATAFRTGLQRAADSALAIRLHSVLVSSGKTADAEKFAGSWLKDHPKDAEFFAHLGNTALTRMDFETAEKNYLSVLQIRPDNVVILNNLAWVMGQLGKDGAIAYAEKATTLAPNQPAFMDTLAMLLAQKKEYARAIELLSKALQLQPSNGQLRLNLAKIYIATGDKARARTELETLSKLGDKFPQAEVSFLLRKL